MVNKKPIPAHKHKALAAGKGAEQRACDYLQAQGLTLVTRNFRSKYGEVDLIMQDGEIIVFIEVKYRTQNNYGGALLSLKPRQQHRIIRTAQFFLMRYPNHQARFDVIAIEGNDEISWIANAFDAG